MQYQTFKHLKKQAGVTLMELIAGISIMAVIIVGAVSLFGTAQGAGNSAQMLKDILAVRSSTQSLYMGQGGYGTASLNGALITASKIPSTMVVSGTTITTSVGGTLTVTGNSSNFTMAVTNLPADVCTQLLTNAATGWSSVRVGSSAALTTFPVRPEVATAAAQCGGTAPFTVTWTTTS